MTQLYITRFITKDNVRRTNTMEKGCGRPRTMFLDWLLKTEEDNISHDELKMSSSSSSSSISLIIHSWQNATMSK